MPELIFHYTPTTCSLASHIALEESGLPFEASRIRLHDPEAVAVWRETNPSGGVPALVSDGRLLTENVAILNYVARLAPEAGLLPDDLFDQATALSLTAWFASTVHITGRMARAPLRFTADETAWEPLKTEGRIRFEANLRKVDALLAGRDWLVGERLSVADAYALVFYAWGVAGDYPMAEMTHYSALARRMAQRPGVQRAMAREKTPPFPS
ncbi:MAG: glutathione S-transferase [Caulobacteraceae bacterium]|nr:glutathione S-transferase [Caulobacteraceae bacterium]